jgi:hypothetical protein
MPARRLEQAEHRRFGHRADAGEQPAVLMEHGEVLARFTVNDHRPVDFGSKTEDRNSATAGRRCVCCYREHHQRTNN